RRQSEAGEDRQLLATDERVQAVDRGDARLDELGRMVTGDGVDRHPVHIPVRVGLQGWPAVDRASGAVEDAPDEIAADGGARDLAARAHAGARQVEAGGAA